MRIVHVITTTGVGGAERMMQRLVGELRRRGHEQVVVGLKPREHVGEELARDGVEVVSFDVSRRRMLSVGAITRLRSLVDRRRPHVVQSWLHLADLLTTVSLVGAMDVRHVWNIRSNPGETFGWPVEGTAVRRPRKGLGGRLLFRACARLSHLPDAVVVNSRVGLRDHRRMGFRPRRWVHIPNGFALERLVAPLGARDDVRRELGIPRDEKVVVMLARTNPVKDHATLLDAIRMLQSRYPVRLVLAGLGTTLDNPVWPEWIRARGLEGKVFPLGLRRDVPSVIAASDVACLSSFSEGFPNVVAEAMAGGRPVVATAVGDVGEIVGDTGIVVPVGDAVAMADGLGRLLEERPEAAARRRDACRERVAERYALGGVADRYEHLYAALRAGSGFA